MTFVELLAEVGAVLCQEGRISYRALKRRFELDDDDIEDLKAELIDAKQLACDEGGKVLVWAGDGALAGATPATPPASAAPMSYTPTHLAERIRAEQAAMDGRGAREGERKTITAVFADLKSSTALLERLDPEEARAIIDPALQIMMNAVHAYEGYVAQALGDGIFALFGAPIAHEDHAQRAVHAALAMQGGMRAYSDSLCRAGGAPLDMRVGINSGDVVVRSIRKEDLHTDYVPVGHSTNLAAKVEQLAEPGTVVITEHTAHLVDGYFRLKAFGATAVKGVERPLELFEVIEVGNLRTRLQVSVMHGLTRFVGRQNEIGQLRQALLEVEEGHGQVVGVVGEPGLGKSRLLHEFKAGVPQDWRVLEANAVSYAKGSPYLPVIELLKRFFEFAADDDEHQRRAKLVGQVCALDQSQEDILPYLLALLGIEEAVGALRHMDPQIRRRRTFDAVRRLLVRASAERPLVLVVEDLHWIDSETQGVLDSLVEALAAVRILLVTNYRPEYRHDWGSRTYYSQLRLAPLLHDEGEQLLQDLVGRDPRLDTLRRQILTRTEGTPFYVEEVVQALAEQGVLVGHRGDYCPGTSTTSVQIPATVHAVLAARIDRLEGEDKALLLQLAVIGREFPLALVREVLSKSDDDLDRSLTALQGAEFLYQTSLSGEAGLVFKHALTQEVAYGAVLQEQRKALHEKVALAIEALYAANLNDHYSVLAHHYSRSGNHWKAVEYLSLAGAQAVQHSANNEAVQLFETALELLANLPESSARMQREIEIQLALGPPFMALQGLASARAESAYLRARELGQRAGRPDQLFAAVQGLHIVYLQQAKFAATRELVCQMLETAQQRDDPVLLLQAHVAAAVDAFCVGELHDGRAHCERATTLYDPRHHALVASYWADHGVASMGFVAKMLRLLGCLDEAVVRSTAAIALARRHAHPPSLAFALYASMVVYESRGEVAMVQERAEEEIRLATEHGFPLWHAWGVLFRGHALAALGDRDAGIAQMQAAMAEFDAIDSQLLRPYCSALLAEALGAAGRAEQGLEELDAALRAVETTGERCYVAELYRLKGELVWCAGTSPNPVAAAQAEEHFTRALDVSRRQGARLLELRAATSLARLCLAQGRERAAREVLAEVHDSFTEGANTTDVRAARALLNELGLRSAAAKSGGSNHA